MARYNIIMLTHVGLKNPNSKEFVIFDYWKPEIVKFKSSRPNSIGFNACNGDIETARDYLFGLFAKENPKDGCLFVYLEEEVKER
jgi:hypothetical protein